MSYGIPCLMYTMSDVCTLQTSDKGQRNFLTMNKMAELLEKCDRGLGSKRIVNEYGIFTSAVSDTHTHKQK